MRLLKTIALTILASCNMPTFKFEYCQVDADGDGIPTNQTEVKTADSEQLCLYGVMTVDCDDGDSSVYPGAEEICNGLDEDCDLEIDEGVMQQYYPDSDNDSSGDASASLVEACSPPIGYVANSDDCDDGDPEFSYYLWCPTGTINSPQDCGFCWMTASRTSLNPDGGWISCSDTPPDAAHQDLCG